MAWGSTLQRCTWSCAVVALLFGTAHAVPASLPRSTGGDGEACSGPTLQRSCKWFTVAAVQQPVEVSGSWPTSTGSLPTVEVATAADRALTPLPGFSLSLQRLTLVNAAVATPGTADVPKLWPLDMFTGVGTNLTLTDVRFVLAEQDFQAYLSYFQGLPQPPTIFFTDGSSFLQIPEWTDGTTVLRSVTLLGGTCSSQNNAAAFLQPAGGPAASSVSGNGCNVRTVYNSTLVSTLKADGSVFTKQLLLVLLVSNATLGYGLQPWAIDIERPVMVAGLFGVPTSVDFGMVVNQINATSKNAQVIWQSLYLENLSPADGLASTLAPPYSGAVSANLYAIYCNRSSQLCLNLYNTTSVLASTQEMDYMTFMYSMFNSPLPNMRQHTDFYHTELAVKIIDMGPGPGGNGMTLHNMSCSAWEIHNSVFTDKAILQIAPKLPFPEGRPLVTTATKAAPWVQGVDSCASLQAGLLAPSEEDRLHVWMLLSNVSIHPASEPSCWQARDVAYTTQVYGQVQGDGVQQVQPALALPEATPGEPAPVAAVNPVFDMFSLGFNYMRSALVLPSDAGEKFLQIQNVTLLQLPQGPKAAKAAGLKAGQGGDGPTPPDVWTILLWPVNRTWQGSPVYLSDVQLLVPQPEYDFVRGTAQSSGSFVVQLADTVGLAFNGISIVGNAVKIGSLQGPGITGQNVWLLADPTAASAMPGGYTWPLGVVAAPTSNRFEDGSGGTGASKAVSAAVGACVGGVGLLALIGLCWWCCVRHRQQQQRKQQQFLVGYKADGSFHCCSEGSGASGPNMQLRQTSGPFIGIAVAQLPDKAADTLLVPGKFAVLPQGQQMPGSCGSGQLLQASLVGSDGITASRSGDSARTSPVVYSAAGSNTVASGLQRWKTAISSTTLQLMERRMHTGTAVTVASGSSTSSGQEPTTKASGAVRLKSGNAMDAKFMNGQAAIGALAAAASKPSTLQLQGMLGQGSFGCVYMGVWHGKRVAVKVMQLPANALLGSCESTQFDRLTGHQLRQAKKLQSNNAPHMAIMETVVSSTMSHPNVVQVYTYMINPLTVEAATELLEGAKEGQQQHTGASANVSGWELRLVMEYCDQGTLREALDHKLLLRDSSSTYLQPSIVLSLAHDVAAAMLHLHSEGVVHGDLKAANVLLTRGGDDPGNVWAATVGHRVTAKVADFGLALPLDPNDTHATMAARGTPTHMSPELFMSGHVSKASDVYAYGILLYEIITGQRAYAGVPIPLLPHEVARQGLRPTWPANLSSSLRDLQRLAEGCWAQQPQHRPPFQLVFNVLDALENGRQPPPLPPQQQLQQQPQQAAGFQAVERGPNVLEERSHEQLQIVQHQLEQRYGSAGADDQAAAGGKDMAWSEVTYGGARKG